MKFESRVRMRERVQLCQRIELETGKVIFRVQWGSITPAFSVCVFNVGEKLEKLAMQFV
jgi:hypothetical protein